MKRKMILFAALVAASSTAFVACSSSDDDVLAQEPVAPAAEETVVEETEGTPLTIKVVDATRGTDYTASTLNKLYLYSTKNGATGVDNRWLGTYDKGASIPEVLTKDGEGKLVTSDQITWQPYTGDVEPGYDFYALSDATFTSEDDGQNGQQEAEHLDASPRTFTYTVTNVYGDQQDLLVGSALNQKSTTNTINPGQVNLNLYHALARIKSIKLAFKATSESNDNYIFLIKSMTLKNIPSTAVFTFPTDENLTVDRKTDSSNPVDNVTGSWSNNPTGLLDYTIVLPDFERDPNTNRIIVFDEIEDTGDPVHSVDPDPLQNEMTAYHPDTKRGGITGYPNFIYFPDGGTTIHEFPLEVGTNTGLYILPQTLAKTNITIDKTTNPNEYRYFFNNGGEDTPYLEITVLGLTDPAHDSSNLELLSSFLDVQPELGGTNYDHGYWNNQQITNAIDGNYLATLRIPLTEIVLEANKAYSLKAYINLAVNHNDNDIMFFSGSKLD